MSRIGVALLALAVVLGACTGDDDATSTTTTPPSTRDAPGTSATPTPASTPAVPPTAAAPASAPATEPSAASSTGTSARASTTVGTDGWCAIAIDLHGLTTAFRQLDAADRQAVEVSLVAILERLAAIGPLAPPELAADLAVSTEAFALLDAALADVDYDLEAADLSALDARTDAIAAANDRIRAYNTAECGIDVGVTGGAEP